MIQSVKNNRHKFLHGNNFSRQSTFQSFFTLRFTNSNRQGLMVGRSLNERSIHSTFSTGFVIRACMVLLKCLQSWMTLLLNLIPFVVVVVVDAPLCCCCCCCRGSSSRQSATVVRHLKVQSRGGLYTTSPVPVARLRVPLFILGSCMWLCVPST